MKTKLNLPYQFIWSKEYPHIAWADLHSNGVLVEIAVVALDQKNGDLYFVSIASLDSVDRERLLKIITKRDAEKYALWDLMSNTTLKNGENALVYFNQLVKVRAVSGQIFTPGAGKVGAVSYKQQMTSSPMAHVEASQVDESAMPQGELMAQNRKGPGRPPKSR